MSKVIKRKIIKGDSVCVISGDDKGKVGRVLKVVCRSFNDIRLVVSGINISRIVKKDSSGSRYISKEFSVHISNVMYFDPVLEKPGRIGFKVVDGRKIRYSKSSGNVIG